MNKYLALVLLAAIAGYTMFGQSGSDDVEAQFQNFVQEYRKSYFSKDEYSFRLQTFQNNLKEIEELNRIDTATYGVNEFADWTPEEKQALLGLTFEGDDSHVEMWSAPAGHTPAGHIDWNGSGKETPIKDQKSCGSCWSFGANEALESRYAIAHGQLFDLSEQELVDCSGSYGNHGCSGGWMYWAYDYVKAKGGLALESEYPYKAVNQKCTADYTKRHAPITGYKHISTSDADLEAAIEQGPVTVAVDASRFSSYTGGIVSTCGTSLNHAVVADGYVADGTDKYWIVRNSWGTRWGESGRIRLKLGNTCGIETKAYFPTV